MDREQYRKKRIRSAIGLLVIFVIGLPVLLFSGEKVEPWTIVLCIACIAYIGYGLYLDLNHKRY